jgi:peroxiredoxin
MMKLFSVHRWTYVFIAILFVACKNNDKAGSGKGLSVSGVITNNQTAKKVYLEELPAGSSQGTIVDSSAIDKDGRYKLKTNPKESVLYGIRLEHNEYPIAYMINDVPTVTVDITLNSQNNGFAEKYEVKGSPASQEMKDFMSRFDNDLQKIYIISQRTDSLKNANAPDSVIAPLIEEWRSQAGTTRDFASASFTKANDPALFLFELGAYESIAERYGLQPLDPEEENDIVNKAAVKFPNHNGLAEIKKSRNENVARMKKLAEGKWVGKQAPDFSLPDPNGKEIKLSSFRGKYVLVDFWASWCVPCREENPNVVKAYSKFKDKNFVILGVSLDNPGEKDKWMTAVMKDNLTWTQVSDLKGWQSAVVPMYDFGEVGIPYNILVSPEGMVIAERLKGAALEAKLEEVLK